MDRFWKSATLALLGLCLPAGQLHAARPGHIVLVIEENHAFTQIIGSPDCPYLNSLARHGALLTRSHAVRHPSFPNYLALFSGSTYGQTDDACPPVGGPFFSGPNLGSLLRAAGFSFTGYSEGLPAVGDTACADSDPNGYRRKHNPWVDFSNLPPDTNQPFSAFPSDYAKLPDLAFVVADLEHDMHNGTPAEGDAWLKQNLSGYAHWAMHHHSVLIVTWDEDNGVHDNRVPTFFYGQDVKPGFVRQDTNHYGMLRTLCSLYGVEAPGLAKKYKIIKGIFK